jgi:enoyl-CoA hydratase
MPADLEERAMSQVVMVEEPRPGIRVITLNRPERLNAITDEVIDGLHKALDIIDADGGARVAILTGAGRGFCAGFDLKSGWDGAPGMEHPTPVQESYRGQQRLADIVSRMRSIPVPFIAAVNGAAAGGGFALALGADIRVASTTAKFLVANVKIGLSGGEMGISYLLPRLIGYARAAELMYTGRTIDASEASSWGLVNRMVDADEVMASAMETAELICSNAPFGVRLTKETLRLTVDAPSLEHALVLENRTQVLAGFSSDLAEAMTAFREGRAPRFAS